MSDRTEAAALGRSERPANIGLTLALVIALIAGVAAYYLTPSDLGPRVTILALAVFGVAGIFFLFAYAVGLIHFSGRVAGNDVTKLVADTSGEGLLVTRGDARIVYANEAYTAMCDAKDASGVQLVERLFSGPPEVSEAIYRLVQAARGGVSHSEDLRLSPPLSGQGPVGWYRIRVRPLPTTSGGRFCLWAVADVTADRQRQENVFQELQHAIDFLDHAPAGFFSASPDGAVS